MVTKKILIEIPTGLEARPIAQLVQVASQFDCSIYLENASKKVNAKSIMGMMTLGLIPGDEITVSTNGNDEVEAAESVAKFLAAC